MVFSSRIAKISIATCLLVFLSENAAARRLVIPRGARRREEHLHSRDLQKRKCKKGKDNDDDDISCAPTMQPTDAPSESPSLSTKPSVSPSESPSFKPTTSPSLYPTPTPTLSLMPSASPSAEPTPVKTVYGTDSEGFAMTSCIADASITTGNASLDALETAMLSFNYLMYLQNDATLEEAQHVTTFLETPIHGELAKLAVSCDFETDDEFLIVSLSAADADKVAGRCPESMSEPNTTSIPDPNTTCWLVDAKITTTVFYTNRRRLAPIHVTVPFFAEWLEIVLPTFANESSGISELGFEGFTRVVLDGAEVDDDVVDRNERIITSPWVLLVVCIAGLVLVVALYGLVSKVSKGVSKRRNRLRDFQARLKEVNDLDLETVVREDIETKAILVNDADDVSTMVGLHKTVDPEGDNKPAVPSELDHPIFVASDVDSFHSGVLLELGPPKNLRKTTGYRVTDTQIL